LFFREEIEKRFPADIYEVMKSGRDPEALCRLINNYLPPEFHLGVEWNPGPVGVRPFLDLIPKIGVREMAKTLRKRKTGHPSTPVSPEKFLATISGDAVIYRYPAWESSKH